MTSQRLHFLLSHFRKFRIDWRKSKSAMARELQDYMDSEHKINPIDNLEGHPCPLTQFNQNSLADNLQRENA